MQQKNRCEEFERRWPESKEINESGRRRQYDEQTPDRQHGMKISAGIFKQSMLAKKRVGKGLSYRPARLFRLAELISWNRFLGSLKVYKFEISIEYHALELDPPLPPSVLIVPFRTEIRKTQR